MARKTNKELNEICQDLGVKTLYSWSRYNTYKSDKYMYYLKYVLKEKPDLPDTSIYGVSGNKAHDILEDFYNGNIKTHEDMLNEYETSLMEFDFAGLRYDRSDDSKNKSIADKYESCLRHFFLHHDKITSKMFLEKFITVKVGEYYFQGYIDAFHKEIRNGEPHIVITDWKTSSIYRGEKVLQEMGQLVLYAEAMRQMTSVPIENIIGRWNFLKYVEVEYTLAKGDKRTRIVERNGIGKALQSNVSMWLRKFGYTEDEIESHIIEMVDSDGDYTNNSIECLPLEVQDKFRFADCYVEIPLTKDVVDNLIDDMIKTIGEIEDKVKVYTETNKEERESVGDKLFWQDMDKGYTYFMANLSDYSAKLHKPYAEYLDELKMFNTEKDVDSSDNDLDWLFD